MLVCVHVCWRERERERKRKKEKGDALHVRPCVRGEREGGREGEEGEEV